MHLTRRALSLSVPALIGVAALPRPSHAAKAAPAVHPIASGLQGGNGVAVLPDGSVALTETHAGTIIRMYPNGATKLFAKPGPGVAGAALGPDGALYVAKTSNASDVPSAPDANPYSPPKTFRGILRVDLATGGYRALYDHAPTGPLQSPGAVVFDSTGGLWFTDAAEGAVYWCSHDGARIWRVLDSLPGASAVALSPGHGTLYVAQGAARRILAYRIVKRGTLARQRGPVRQRLVATLATPVTAMTTEAGGNLVVATGAGLSVVSPAGQTVTMVGLPSSPATALGFDGAHPRTLFVASVATLASIAWPRRGLEANFA